MVKIVKLLLTNFRNFTSKKLTFDKNLIFLCGQNGIGKTNILESLTLFGRSSYLRSSNFEEMVLDGSNNKEFTIFSQLDDHEFIENIGILFDVAAKKKTMQINGENLNAKRQNDVKNHLINFIYLTPQIEQLFISGKSSRRQYLDKIVCDIDLEHQNRLTSYQKLLKERLLILQKYGCEKTSQKWLDIIEEKIASLGTSIAFARVEAIDFFNNAIANFDENFPKAKLLVSGQIEEMTLNKKAIEIEKFYLEKLQENRHLDKSNFKSNFGIHRSDFDAIFLKKDILATRSSTGEQKAIMIGITLARAKISANYKNLPTILIFDEIFSHLDEGRKINLVNEIATNNLQAFFSATSSDLLPQKILDLDETQIINL